MMQLGRRWQLPAALATAPVIAVAMALAVPPAFGWTLGAAIGAGWIGLLLLAAIGSWRALVRKRPLVDFEARSEEHTSELQSLMRISYAVFCLKKKKNARITEVATQYA